MSAELITKPHVVQAKYRGETVYRKFFEPRIGDEAFHEEHFQATKAALKAINDAASLSTDQE